MKNKKRNRRKFISEISGLTGAGYLALNTPLLLAVGRDAAEQRANGDGWMHFTDHEADVLSAVVDQILPPDDLPGASEMGVVYFIDQALGGFVSAGAGLLEQGLADLDRRAQEKFPGSSGFAGLTFDQQTVLLQEIDTTPFFNQMIFLTHCGAFSDPHWGGNRDGAGWALLGFDNRHSWQPPFGHYDAQVMAQEGAHDQN